MFVCSFFRITNDGPAACCLVLNHQWTPWVPRTRVLGMVVIRIFGEKKSFSCWWNVGGTWWIPLIFTNSVPNILGWLYLSFNNIGSFLRIELSRGSFINSNWEIYVCLLFSPLGRNFQCNFSELWTISIHCKWILCPLGGDKVFPGWKPEQMNGEQRRNTTRSEWAREVR